MSERSFPLEHEAAPHVQVAPASIDVRQTLPEGVVVPRAVLPFRQFVEVHADRVPVRRPVRRRAPRWREVRSLVLAILILVTDALVLWTLLRRH